jgi:hypothetical protein
MILIERVFWGHMLAATALLSIGFAAVGMGPCSLGLILLGLVWFLTQQQKSYGFEGLLLYANVIAAAAGLFFGLPAWLVAIAVVASLGAWDLYSFLLRLSRADRVEYESGLGREHLRRLAYVEMAALAAGFAVIFIHPRISFWWEALLVLIVIIGLSRIFARIRKEIE